MIEPQPPKPKANTLLLNQFDVCPAINIPHAMKMNNELCEGIIIETNNNTDIKM